LAPAANALKLVGEDYISMDNHRQHIRDKLKPHGAHSLLKFAFDNSAYL